MRAGRCPSMRRARPFALAPIMAAYWISVPSPDVPTPRNTRNESTAITHPKEDPCFAVAVAVVAALGESGVWAMAIALQRSR